jgi:hypothetical protein
MNTAKHLFRRCTRIEDLESVGHPVEPTTRRPFDVRDYPPDVVPGARVVPAGMVVGAATVVVVTPVAVVRVGVEVVVDPVPASHPNPDVDAQ